jgi:hypothetical protein
VGLLYFLKKKSERAVVGQVERPLSPFFAGADRIFGPATSWPNDKIWFYE